MDITNKPREFELVSLPSQVSSFFRRLIGKSKSHARIPAVGDTYYGDKAQNYLEERMKQPYWRIEQESVQLLLAALPKGISVLDVPFGTGRFLDLYLNRGMQVHGVDASGEMLAAAKSHWGHKTLECDLQIGDATSLPFAEDCFDLVVSFRFLQSIVPFGVAKNVLGELHRVTKKYAIIQLRVRDSHVPRASKVEDHEPMSNNLYFHEVLNLLSEIGFRAQKVLSNETRRMDSEQFVFLCEKVRPQNLKLAQ